MGVCVGASVYLRCYVVPFFYIVAGEITFQYSQNIMDNALPPAPRAAPRGAETPAYPMDTYLPGYPTPLGEAPTPLGVGTQGARYPGR